MGETSVENNHTVQISSAEVGAKGFPSARVRAGVAGVRDELHTAAVRAPTRALLLRLAAMLQFLCVDDDERTSGGKEAETGFMQKYAGIASPRASTVDASI